MYLAISIVNVVFYAVSNEQHTRRESTYSSIATFMVFKGYTLISIHRHLGLAIRSSVSKMPG